MAWTRKKRTYGKKKSSGRKTWWRRKQTKMRRGGGQKKYYFTRMVNLATITSNDLLDQKGAFTFPLSILAHVTDFTALYDQYKICGVKVYFIPYTNQTAVLSTTGTVANITPRIITAIDYDDNTTPLDFNELRERQSAKVISANRYFTRWIRPKFLSSAYVSGVSTGYVPKTGYVDTVYTSMPHYGMKYVLEATGSGSSVGAWGYKVEGKYYLGFKNVK